MKARSGRRNVDESVPDIALCVRGLLAGAGVGSKLPTPVNDIVEYSKLVRTSGTDLLEYQESLQKRGLRFVGDIFRKIKGLIDFREKTVYVIPGLHPSREKFVTFHEVGHKILSWHEGFFNPLPLHYDTEVTLDLKRERGLDAEANVAASLIQFQVDRFRKDSASLPMTLGSAEILSQTYETSRHSTFRRFVEDSGACCALLVMNLPDYDRGKNKAFVSLSYPVQSEQFTKRYGYIDWQDIHYKGDPVFDLITKSPGDVITCSEMSAKTLTGMDEIWEMETTWNNFNHFVLLYRKLPSIFKKKITVKSSS